MIIQDTFNFLFCFLCRNCRKSIWKP